MGINHNIVLAMYIAKEIQPIMGAGKKCSIEQNQKFESIITAYNLNVFYVIFQ
jgi:hypothetical protein